LAINAYTTIVIAPLMTPILIGRAKVIGPHGLAHWVPFQGCLQQLKFLLWKRKTNAACFNFVAG
jgi:hypothetical protein